MSEENRVRSMLYKSLMDVPHRNIGGLVIAFREAMVEDPDFVARLCVWLNTPDSGVKIRDQQDAGVVALLQAPATFPEYREAGRCVLVGRDVYAMKPEFPGLPPYRVLRVERFMSSPWFVAGPDGEIERFFTSAKAQAALPKLARKASLEENQLRVARDAQHNRASTLMHTLMADYVCMLEKSPVRLDGILLQPNGRKGLKNLIGRFGIPHSDRTNALLFGEPPEDSKLHVLKLIAASDNVREQIRLIVENRIPYTVASSVLPKMGPAVSIALIETMTPTEALNSRAWIEASGVLEIAEVKTVYLEKISRATASIASTQHRRSAQGKDSEVQAAVGRAQQKAVDRSQKIEKATLIEVDVSSSMERAIEAAKEFAYRIAPQCAGPLMMTAFNDRGRVVPIKDWSFAGVQAACRGLRASGATNMEAGLDAAVRNGFTPQQIVLLTDGGRNRGDFCRGLRGLERAGVVPNVVVIGTPNLSSEKYRRNDASNLRAFTSMIENAGFSVDLLVYQGDWLIFDQVVALLGGPPAQTLVDRVLDTVLPARVQGFTI